MISKNRGHQKNHFSHLYMSSSTSSSTKVNTVTMSKTRALKQLKTIEARLQRAYDRTKFVTISTRGNKKVLRDDISNAASTLQSIRDLIAWRDAVKVAILQSNATEMLEIEGLGKYPVAFWIEKKKSIRTIEGALLRTLKTQYKSCKSTVEREQASNESKLTRLLEQQFGGSGSTSSNTQNAIVNTFWDQWRVELVDTANIEEQIAKLEDKIATVNDELDTALQEHNAQCQITVPDPKSILL